MAYYRSHNKHLLVASLATAASMVCHGTTAGGLRLEAGPVFRGGMRASADGSSHVQNQGLTSARARRIPPPPSGSPAIPPDYGNWDYDDGFVYIDMGTLGDSTTWYWGYQDNRQFDADSLTLTFSRARTRTAYDVSTWTRLDAPADFSDTFHAWGAELVAGYPVGGENSPWSEICLGLAWLRSPGSTMGGTTRIEDGRRERQQMRDVDFFVHDTYGLVPPAPYEGTYTGPGVFIANIPGETGRFRETSRTGARTWTARNHITIETDTDILSLWLGPRLDLELTQETSLSVTPRLSLNHLRLRAYRSEVFEKEYSDGSRIARQSWSDRESRDLFRFGAGVNAGLDWHSGDRWFAGLRAGYEWVPEKARLSVGPNRVSVDASGYTLSAAAGFRFGGDGAPRL